MSSYWLLGLVVVLIGAALELRHLVRAVLKHFDGCHDLKSVLLRARDMDDVTLAGAALCAALAVGLVVTIGGQIVGRA